MNTQILHLIKYYLRGHWRLHKVTHYVLKSTFRQIFFLSKIWSYQNFVSMITKMQIFHNMKFDVKGHWTSHMVIFILKKNFLGFFHLKSDLNFVLFITIPWKRSEKLYLYVKIKLSRKYNLKVIRNPVIYHWKTLIDNIVVCWRRSKLCHNKALQTSV